MAASDTKRDQIIEAVKAELQAMPDIAHVVRRLPSYSDLESFASTQFPAVAIVGRLPVPTEHITSRAGHVDHVVSELKVDLYCYFQDNKTPDSTISFLLNQLWAALYSDQTKGGLVITTRLKPRERPEVWAPYGAFGLTVITRYQHTPGGI